jgi:hypothetical protein
MEAYALWGAIFRGIIYPPRFYSFPGQEWNLARKAGDSTTEAGDPRVEVEVGDPRAKVTAKVGDPRVDYWGTIVWGIINLDFYSFPGQ